MGRKIYMDLGANNGDTVAAFLRSNPGWMVFAFEPNPILARDLRGRFLGDHTGVMIMEYAAWIADGIIDLYLGASTDVSSTILTGKQASPEWAVNYEAGTRVQSIDFDRWFRENTALDDTIILKMDIEGAEYKVLSRCADSGSISRIKQLLVEWHWDRYPSIGRVEHDRIRRQLQSIVALKDWG